MGKDDKEGSLDYEELGDQLKKAGIATMGDMKQSMNDMFTKFMQTSSSKSDKDGGMEDLGTHLRGECGNPKCGIANEAKKLYEDGYRNGLTHGTKLGGIAAKRGVTLK